MTFYHLFLISGAVKITPAHDHNDYEVGKRNKLQEITIIDDSGNMTPDCGQFAVSTCNSKQCFM